MNSLRTECSIRVRMTALLEYIDLFSVECPKRSNVTRSDKTSLIAQKYTIHIMVSISCSVCAIQIL